jgi:hypothetical protein
MFQYHFIGSSRHLPCFMFPQAFLEVSLDVPSRICRKHSGILLIALSNFHREYTKSKCHSTKPLGWAGRVDQVVENLPTKHEALSSNPSIIEKKKKPTKTKNQIHLDRILSPLEQKGCMLKRPAVTLVFFS